MQMQLVFVLALLLASVGVAGQSQINKCEIDGKVVYTDKPCPPGSSRELQLNPLNAIPAPGVDANGLQGDTGSQGYQSSRWYEDYAGYNEALRVSKATKAPIFIYGYADWCRFCQKFEASLLPSAAVKETLAGYVKVRINPEHSREDEGLFKQWGGRGYPSLFIQSNSQSRPMHRGSPFAQGKLLSEAEFDRRYGLDFTVESTPIVRR